jgi:hypothetical protein
MYYEGWAMQHDHSMIYCVSERDTHSVFSHAYIFFFCSYYRILTMVYNFQKYWVFGLYEPSSF